MSEEERQTLRAHIPDISRFIIFIAASIVIAFVLVVISMELYQKSGAAQLDLSRPSYEDVRSKAAPMKVNTFSSSGPIDKESLDEFKKVYDSTQEDILEKKDIFSADAISDKTLGIDVR